MVSQAVLAEVLGVERTNLWQSYTKCSPMTMSVHSLGKCFSTWRLQFLREESFGYFLGVAGAFDKQNFLFKVRTFFEITNTKNQRQI